MSLWKGPADGEVSSREGAMGQWHKHIFSSENGSSWAAWAWCGVTAFNWHLWIHFDNCSSFAPLIHANSSCCFLVTSSNVLSSVCHVHAHTKMKVWSVSACLYSCSTNTLILHYPWRLPLGSAGVEVLFLWVLRVPDEEKEKWSDAGSSHVVRHLLHLAWSCSLSEGL